MIASSVLGDFLIIVLTLFVTKFFFSREFIHRLNIVTQEGGWGWVGVSVNVMPSLMTNLQRLSN